MNQKIKLKSGAMLEMTLLDFETGLSLFSKVSEELLKINVDLGNVDLTDLTNTDLDKDILNTLKNIVLSMVVSKELRIGLNDAFGRCLYNNLKIDNETFESVETRSDYFMVCWEVLRFNLSPFLPKIDLLSSLKAGINTNIPKQK